MNKSDIIKNFLDMIGEAESTLPTVYSLVNDLDKATQDIMHKLELEDLSYKENCKLMTQLKTIRKDRRYYKDKVEQYMIISQYYKENRKPVDLLRQKLGEMRKVEEYHSTRTYRPRVLKGEQTNERT